MTHLSLLRNGGKGLNRNFVVTRGTPACAARGFQASCIRSRRRVMKRTILAFILASCSAVSTLTGQESAERLGPVHFPISCTPVAQRQFDRALAMLHNFWYPQDLNAFREVTQTDPSCAIAYWGVAI